MGTMKTLLIITAAVAITLLGGCISVEDDTPDHVTVERTTVVE